MPLQLPRRPAKTSRRASCSAHAGGSIPTLDQSASAMLLARSSRAESAAWTTRGERNKARIPTSSLREREHMGGPRTKCLQRSRRNIRIAETVCFPPEKRETSEAPSNSECQGQLEREVSR